jgi:DNA repair protein RadC
MTTLLPETFMSRYIKVPHVCEVKLSAEESYMRRPAAAAAFFWKHISTAKWFNQDEEFVVLLCLNRQQEIFAYCLVSIGTHDLSLVSPLECFRPATSLGASAIILIHNHPSNSTNPGAADKMISTQMAWASERLSIDFHDHVIVGRNASTWNGNNFYSFREAKLI